MSPVSSPPTSERGVVSNGISSVSSWSSIVDDIEYAPDLRWPLSLVVYDKMRADTQINGLLTGTILPITRFRWFLRDNGCDPAVTDAIAQQLKVPVQGREDQFQLGRMRNRFSWNKHLHDLLRALYYGHYFFEQVGAVEDDGLWHLRKLAPRPPRTISDIAVAKDGGLEGIKQFGTEQQIPVDRLLAYAWDKEGGNWIGRSMLRPLFRSWVVKDRLIRVDAGKHERNGMGVPWFEAPEGASQDLIDALDELAQAFRSGDEAGGAGPHGAKLRLVGTEGTLPDTIGSIRYHDEQMANSFLMMFMQLGQTATGSRALGSEFIDFFGFAQEAVADWARDTFNEHMIEDMVDWNWGEDHPAPLLDYERSSNEDLPTADLALLVKDGIVKVDDELESAIRKRYKLPEKSAATPTPSEQVPPTPEGEPTQAGGKRRSVKAAEPNLPSTVSLPDRTLRRQPYDHEVVSATDYAQMDAQWTARRDDLFDVVRSQQEAQVDQLVKQIEAADGDISQLSAISADPAHEEAILSAMQDAADDGIGQAEAEAKAQGKTGVKRPKLSELEDSLAARAKAMDEVLTRELSSAASQRAIARTGGSLDAKAVASAVKEYLLNFKGARVKQQLNGVITQAMNSGRKIYMAKAEPTRVYASELLDENTCENCTSVDGTEYDNVSEAELDYPGGGYSECLGGDNCRGTLVAVYGEVAPGTGEAS